MVLVLLLKEIKAFGNAELDPSIISVGFVRVT